MVNIKRFNENFTEDGSKIDSFIKEVLDDINYILIELSDVDISFNITLNLEDCFYKTLGKQFLLFWNIYNKNRN